MEDRIRKLCSQILAATKDEEIEPLLVELREALRLHIESLRRRLGSYPFLVERRQRSHFPPLDERTEEDAAKKADSADVRS
jgi:regulator of replication initiation timing